jgi:hypothetical protein
MMVVISVSDPSAISHRIGNRDGFHRAIHLPSSSSIER